MILVHPSDTDMAWDGNRQLQMSPDKDVGVRNVNPVWKEKKIHDDSSKTLRQTFTLPGPLFLSYAVGPTILISPLSGRISHNQAFTPKKVDVLTIAPSPLGVCE